MTLLDFIMRAKLAGYATGGEDREVTFDDGSKGFAFADDEYRYLDRYYGFNPFSGSEHVYTGRARLIWKMNYFGAVAEDFRAPEKIYAFLREAMSRISPEYPLRGPAALDSAGFAYRNRQHGTLNAFHGLETIHAGDQQIYYLHYHGGTLDGSS